MAMKNIKNSLAGLLILGIVSFGIGPFLAPQAQALSVTTYSNSNPNLRGRSANRRQLHNSESK
jgi:hypothetical protein